MPPPTETKTSDGGGRQPQNPLSEPKSSTGGTRRKPKSSTGGSRSWRSPSTDPKSSNGGQVGEKSSGILLLRNRFEVLCDDTDDDSGSDSDNDNECYDFDSLESVDTGIAAALVFPPVPPTPPPPLSPKDSLLPPPQLPPDLERPAPTPRESPSPADIARPACTHVSSPPCSPLYAAPNDDAIAAAPHSTGKLMDPSPPPHHTLMLALSDRLILRLWCLCCFTPCLCPAPPPALLHTRSPPTPHFQHPHMRHAPCHLRRTPSFPSSPALDTLLCPPRPRAIPLTTIRFRPTRPTQ